MTAPERTCGWLRGDSGTHWTSACVANWDFEEYGPQENGFRYCPQCGGAIQVHDGTFADWLDVVMKQAANEPDPEEHS